jgi:signal transduction histidine kinase
MSRNRIAVCIVGGALVAAYALAVLIFRNLFFRTAIGDLVPAAILCATIGVSLRNTIASRGHTRFFWGLVTLGMAMWFVDHAGWVWFEVLARKPLPDPFFGDAFLFLHIVPIMAAIAIGAHRVAEQEGTHSSTLNVLILLTWWVVVYAFIVFPDEFVVPDLRVYARNWDVLYLVEELVLIVLSGRAWSNSQGAWRELYRALFLASTLYAISSEIINIGIARKTYASGGVYDIPFLVAMLAFFWAAWLGRARLRETQAPTSASDHGRLATLLAKLALLSLPVMAYWALFVSEAPILVRQVRFGVTMIGTAALAFFVFFRQQLLDRKLVEFLEQSQSSYSNLQRLQGRVVQQEKLASLGELVALAATELDYPLSAILENTERLATSSGLRLEQLSTARKIGQQARRTRELVNDLLSFAQQTPGEKSPLDLKPLLQRAMQMEGFKLENRGIKLAVESEEPLPRVRANANQLMQAFLQIIENAVDALQEVGGGRLVISLWHENNEVVVEFADTGSGVRNPERVFDPFYTTKPVGKGTGLGLSAAYGVIQEHKGQIHCYNRPEGGAVFEVRLPVLRPGAALRDSAARI